MGDLVYRCATCGETHRGLPDLAFEAPIHYADLASAERAEVAELTPDFCVIREQDFFIRVCLPIPIKGTEDKYVWGVWVSLSERNFVRYAETFHRDLPPGEGPYFAWLSNRIPGYPDTLNLKALVHLRPGGERPTLELERTDHLLAVHQREGIELPELAERVRSNHP